jgi:hypothetical protein
MRSEFKYSNLIWPEATKLTQDRVSCTPDLTWEVMSSRGMDSSGVFRIGTITSASLEDDIVQ